MLSSQHATNPPEQIPAKELRTANPKSHQDGNGATPILSYPHSGQSISPCQQHIQGQTISQEFHSIPVFLNPTAWLIYACSPLSMRLTPLSRCRIPQTTTPATDFDLNCKPRIIPESRLSQNPVGTSDV